MKTLPLLFFPKPVLSSPLEIICSKNIMQLLVLNLLQPLSPFYTHQCVPQNLRVYCLTVQLQLLDKSGAQQA